MRPVYEHRLISKRVFMLVSSGGGVLLKGIQFVKGRRGCFAALKWFLLRAVGICCASQARQLESRGESPSRQQSQIGFW